MTDGGGTGDERSCIDDLAVPAIHLRDGSVVEANTAARELLAPDAGDLVGCSLDALLGIDEPLGTTPRTVVVGTGAERRHLELTPGPARPDGSQIVVLRDASAERFTHRILSEIANATSIVDSVGQRYFGPVGREIKEGTEVPGSVADRVHPEDIGRALDAYVKVQAEPGARATLVVRAMDPMLEGRWAEARIQIINQLDDPEVGGLIVSIDSFELTEAVESIGRTSSSYLSVAAAAPVGIVLSGPKGFAVYFNEAAQRLIPGVGVGDQDRDWIEHASEQDRPRLRQMLDDSPQTGEWYSTVARFDRAGEDPTWLLVTVAPRVVEDERVIGMVTTLQDVTGEIQTKNALEDAQQRLLHLATHDPLTGLANRAHVTEELTARLGSVTAAGPVAVLFCDLDGFKAINDSHGHGLGDAVLAEIGHRLRTALRDQGPDGFADVVARFGGDEFVVLADGTDRVALDALVERLTEVVAEPIVVGTVEASLGMSIGIAVAEPVETADQVLSRADQAMYAAKATGRDRLSP